MNIIDLTGGYSELVEYSKDYEKRYAKKRWFAAAISSDFRLSLATLHPSIGELIDSVPVFLVDKFLSKKYVDIPDCDMKIYVPDDKKPIPDGTDFDIEKWIDSNNPKKDPIIIDILGLYEHDENRVYLPRRIFVWVDKIGDLAKKYVLERIKEQPNCYIKLDEMANALFDVVLSHERGHALMDVELYGVAPSQFFSYSNDYIYFFIEEAYANAYALTTTMNSLTGKQQDFIKSFVSNQIDGYRKGWDWYEEGCYNYSQWMLLKCETDFNSKKQLLRDFWDTKDFSVLSR